MLLATGLCALVFAAIHLFVGRLRFLGTMPRNRWLSFSGGVAVAYVFLHVLPELSAHRTTLAEGLSLSERAAEAGVYLAALAGLVLFYGMERAVKLSRAASAGDRVESATLWLHLASFAVYNLLIGYLLLHTEERDARGLALYAVAMSLHFVTTDFGLREDQKELYDHVGRWVIAGAVGLGWAVGALVAVPPVGIGLLFAFLAGSVVLNVLKEELPEERKSQYAPFLLGVAGYAALLIAFLSQRPLAGPELDHSGALAEHPLGGE